MNIRIGIQTLDTGLRLAARGLLDSGCTRTSIDHAYVRGQRLATQRAASARPIYNADGSLNGYITEFVELVVTIRDSLGREHRERRDFPVVNLGGKQDIFLGFDWLEEHNPLIDWRTKTIELSRCPAPCLVPVAMPSDAVGGFHDNTPLLVDYLDTFVDETAYDYIRAFQTISTKIEQESAKTAVQIPSEYADFADVFEPKEFDKLPPHRQWDHEINLRHGWENDRKLRGKVYPLSPREQAALDEFIDENLRTGRIRPSNSPVAAPFFFVGKKDGGLRPVQDYRRLNDHTVRDSYPLPLISDVITKMRKAKYFSKFDVRWGYNNVRVREGDEFKAAFITNRGLFEPLVMFFGMTNSPATFQRMMDDVFGDYVRRLLVVIYMDDMCVYTETLEEHRRVVRGILELCRRTGLYLKLDKCEFEKREIKFLGLIIGNGEVRMDPVKVEAVRRWPTPRNLREVRSFMQFCNFYRNFIPQFATVTKPFNRLTEKGVLFEWGPDQQRAFDDLRAAVCDDVTLLLPRDGAPFRLETDASDYAAGGVLHQIVEGKSRPLAFFSKSFNSAERNYEIYDKEMLAVMLGLEHWRHFLKGAPRFEIWTDHRNLQYFREPQKLNRRQARWFTELSEYDFTMHHRPGKTNIVADELSRKDRPKEGVKDNDDVVLLTADHFRSLTTTSASRTAEHDVVIRRLGFRDEEEILAEIRRRRTQRDDEVVKGLLTEPRRFTETNGIVEVDGAVYVPIDRHLRERIVAAHHDTPIAGHPGKLKTLELIRRNYWWPRMTSFVERYVAGCDACQRHKPRHGPLAAPLQPNEAPSRPWEIVSCDLIGPLPESAGFNAIQVTVDRHTKAVIAVPTHITLSSEGSARLYRDHVWKRFGLFRKMISDRGPQFVSSFARDLYALLGVEANPSTAYHPQTDGQTERENAEVEKFLRLFVNARQDDWAEWLAIAEFAINNRISDATKASPFFLNHGYHPRMGVEPRRAVRNESAAEFAERMSKSWDEAKAALDMAAKTMKTQYDKHRAPARTYAVGDQVWLEATNLRTDVPAKKLAGRRVGPFKILEKVGASSYKLELPPRWAKVHPVFNEGLLSPHTPPFAEHQHRDPPPPPTIIDDEEEYDVEEILDSRRAGRGVQYLVKFEGWTDEHNEWLPRGNLDGAHRVLREFCLRYPKKPQNVFDDLPQNLTQPRRGNARVRAVRSPPVFPRDLFPADFFDPEPGPPFTTGIDRSLPDPRFLARWAFRRVRTSPRP